MSVPATRGGARRRIRPNDPTAWSGERTRRELFRLFGGAAALVGLSACSGRMDGGAGSSATRATTASSPPSSAGSASTSTGGQNGTTVPSAAFAQPDVLTSRDGVLACTLEARAAHLPYGDGTRFAYTYNGTSPGPTLRVRPGDELRITLHNRLDEATNLHTHGLHVSSEGDGDNIFVSVAPGASQTYRYRIPADHHSGLFWYHPHEHGMVAAQLSGGMAGAIIVADAIDDVALDGTVERLLVLSDPRIGPDRRVLDVSMMQQMQGREGDTVLVNGVHQPTISTTAGALERWRLLNASASRYYRLALDGMDITLIATDGGRLARPESIVELLLAPGERAEVLVAPTAPGTVTLRALPYGRGGPGMGMAGQPPSSDATVTVATVDVSGTATAAALPTSLAVVHDLRTATIARERTIVLAMGMGGGAGGMGGGMGNGGMGGGGMGGSFTIDGKTFDPARTDITARLGTVEEWTIRNTSTMDHPFHLHVWPFQVVGRSDGTTPAPAWKDTVNVPAGQWVKVRLAFDAFPGRTVYHCHILDHEDLGMMGIIEVTAA